MAIYAIGDVQGCFKELQKLLTIIQFNPQHDSLWFTGDLVNRGPQSLDVLRFIKNLGPKHIVVLGNHDLHLLAVYYKVKELQAGDTLAPILSAPDCGELIDWLCTKVLFYANDEYAIAHAGLAPCWTIDDAKRLAEEVESQLHGPARINFLQHMYGNQPDKWDESLTGIERLRCITNYLTRMRFCYADGRLNFSYKGNLADKPAELMPWYHVNPRANANYKIIFGHWAALNGDVTTPYIYPLDTGCVWGRELTAMRLGDEKRFKVNAES